MSQQHSNKRRKTNVSATGSDTEQKMDCMKFALELDRLDRKEKELQKSVDFRMNEVRKSKALAEDDPIMHNMYLSHIESLNRKKQDLKEVQDAKEKLFANRTVEDVEIFAYKFVKEILGEFKFKLNHSTEGIDKKYVKKILHKFKMLLKLKEIVQNDWEDMDLLIENMMRVSKSRKIKEYSNLLRYKKETLIAAFGNVLDREIEGDAPIIRSHREAYVQLKHNKTQLKEVCQSLLEKLLE